jgi:hypothetical protein
MIRQIGARKGLHGFPSFVVLPLSPSPPRYLRAPLLPPIRSQESTPKARKQRAHGRKSKKKNAMLKRFEQKIAKKKANVSLLSWALEVGINVERMSNAAAGSAICMPCRLLKAERANEQKQEARKGQIRLSFARSMSSRIFIS